MAVNVMNLSQQNSNTKPTTKQTNRSGGAHDGGQQFEIKMAAVIGLRGMVRGDNFVLATNVKDAENFDDLLYTAGGRRYFLQLKHTDNVDKNKLTKENLVPLLQKCFKSYCAIKHSKYLRDIPIDKTEFIIYTNKKLDPKLLKHARQQRETDIMFKTCDKGEIFNFTPDKDKKIDVYTLVENSVKKTKEFLDSCVLNEFLKKLIIATGQKGHEELDDLITDEIKKQNAIKLDDAEYKSILQHFKTPLETWWRNKKIDNMTPAMLTNWLQRAKTECCTPLVRSWFKCCTNDLPRTRIKFSDSEISRLKKELSNKRAVHMGSDALTLCSILLLDCLPQSKCIFVNFELLQFQREELLHAWLGGVWEWLIVSCDATVQQSDITDSCHKISEIMKSSTANKRVIILTEYSVQQVTGFVLIDHTFNFEQLSQKSQEMVLDKKIDFQGCEVTMRSVLQRHGNVEHVLRPELITDLITEGTAVNIGGKLHVNTGYYAHRVLERKVWLQLNILRKRGTYPDIFAVSGMQENELADIVPSDEEAGTFCFEEESVTENTTRNCVFEKSRFFVLRGRYLKSSFSKFGENHSGKTLHRLKYKDGKLLWKETSGDVGNLLDCIDAEGTGIDKEILRDCMSRGSCEADEESVWDLGERTVLVVAEPGMGKSSSTTHVAWHTKEHDPTSWVVRINWNDHTRELQDIDEATFNLDTLVEFLRSAAFPNSKYTDINSSLLKQALQSSGNVTVLMDGFDEISPTYADKAAVILSKLKKSKAGRIWVTSRPVVREKLESELCVKAFTLKKLSYESQERMFQVIWKMKANGNDDNCLKEYIKVLLSKANESIHPKNFTGYPLHIWVMASAFEGYLDNSLRFVQISLPEKLDLFYLYERFPKIKLYIYDTEKKMEDFTNACVQDDHERSMETYLENLEKCSLLDTVPSELNSLHDKTIGPTIQPFIRRVMDGKDKIGIVMNVVEGKPQFVHRTFAEYFTARWFSKNFKSNRRVLEHILFDPKYSFVRDMFDRMLAEGYQLHCAVLERNTEAVENLLHEGFDVNAMDKGGRSAMHLIAAERHGGDKYEEITNSILRYKAFVDAVDDVLQWTPLRYAIKTGNWFFVERLLEKYCNRNELDFIRQRVDDGSYIGKIIDDIRGKNYSLLHDYLAIICANTNWAPLIDAAVDMPLS